MKVRISDLRIGKMKYDFIFLDNYLLQNGKENRRISNSPHYKLLTEYEKNPELEIRKSDYFTFAKAHLGYFGRFFGHKDENGIIWHIRQFLEIYEDVRDTGFSYMKGKIIVFKSVHDFKKSDKFGRPHPATSTYTPENYEIYEGHHRAAILAALGYEEIEVDTYSRMNVLKNGILKKLASFNKKMYPMST